MKTIEEIVRLGNDNRASDIHIACDSPVMYRIDGELQKLDDDVQTYEDCERLGEEMAKGQFVKMKDSGELDLAATYNDVRVRINLFRSKGTTRASLRILHSHIPQLSTLGLPPVVNDFPSYNKGIILVTGETGSGKSTTMAAILNEINHTRREHIITLEDPIEYIYENDKCLISQREIGTDTESYAEGLRAILREDPDVILIGEMRDSETIETALTAAETGHLVFATLHTNSAVDSVDRIVGTFPAEKHDQVRMQLSTTLKAVLSQQLLLRKGGKGRAAAVECMIMTPAIKNLIREGNTAQMESALLSSANLGSITMDNCLINMVKNNIIEASTAVEAANNAEYVRQNVGASRGAYFDPKGGGKKI